MRKPSVSGHVQAIQIHVGVFTCSIVSSRQSASNKPAINPVGNPVQSSIAYGTVLCPRS